MRQHSRLQPDERRLFSVGPREDPRPAGFAESSFSFLDRVAQPYWERIRDELDRWFDDFPTCSSHRCRFASATSWICCHVHPCSTAPLVAIPTVRDLA